MVEERLLQFAGGGAHLSGAVVLASSGFVGPIRARHPATESSLDSTMKEEGPLYQEREGRGGAKSDRQSERKRE